MRKTYTEQHVFKFMLYHVFVVLFSIKNNTTTTNNKKPEPIPLKGGPRRKPTFVVSVESQEKGTPTRKCKS